MFFSPPSTLLGNSRRKKTTPKCVDADTITCSLVIQEGRTEAPTEDDKAFFVFATSELPTAAAVLIAGSKNF